mgnify:CR=1 FL=1
MPVRAAPGEKYTIRQKIFKIFGGTFEVFDAEGGLVATCRQKAFRLREDMRFYAGDDPSSELFSMRARSILDFSTTYDVRLPTGESLGSLRRKGLASTFVRDEWALFDPDETTQVGRLIEDSASMSMLRRYLPFGNLVPQKFHLEDASGTTIAGLRTHFNPLVYRLGVSIESDHEHLDELFVLAAACLVAAIEGRQDNSG